jgi:1-hydroxycarotenoid 3,4-desaturase
MSAAPTVAVVGAGMGGLAAAMDLASRGYRVTLFEAHPTVGGKMRAPVVDGIAVDSGPTVFTMRWIFDGLFEDSGVALEDCLLLQRADVLARHGWADGSRLDLFADQDASLAAIEAFAGKVEADAYQRFVKDSGRIFDTLDRSFMQAQRPNPVALSRRVGLHRIGDLWATKPFVSLHRDLSQRFRDPRLVQLFGRYATYCGSSPFRAPATLALIAEAERRGVWYLAHGMQALASAMAQRFEDLGGTLALSTAVQDLQIRNRTVHGLLLAQGQRWSGDAVIFAGDTEALAGGQLGDAARSAVKARPEADFSLSAVTLSARARWQGWPLSHHTVLFSDDYAREFETLLEHRQPYARPTVYLCAPSAARGLDERGTGALFGLANAPAGPLPEPVIDGIEASLKAQLSAFGLQVDWLSVQRTGPNDFAQMFPGSRGALYGRATHGWLGSFARPGSRARLRGLYLAGASVHPGAGIPMATQSGRLAAAALAQDLPVGT